MVDRKFDGQRGLALILCFDIFDGRSVVKLMGLYGWSQVALGASVCGPGPLLGFMLSVLGPMLAILSCSWASTGGSEPLLGPV